MWYTWMTSIFKKKVKNEDDKYIYFIYFKFINLNILLLSQTTA
jgi:hypothetical protein